MERVERKEIDREGREREEERGGERGEGVPGVIAASLTVRAQGWACDPHLTEYRFHFCSHTPLTVTVAALSQKAHTLIHNLFLSLSHTHTHTHAHTYMHYCPPAFIKHCFKSQCVDISPSAQRHAQPCQHNRPTHISYSPV